MSEEIEIAILKNEIDRLQMSNIKLIAELGEIAKALGAGPSMREVLDKIELLKKDCDVQEG